MKEQTFFQPPLDRIEVINRRGSHTAMIFIIALPTTLITLMILSSSIRNAAYAAILFVFAIFFFIGLMIFNQRRNSVRSFDASGVMRGDGRRFSWSDFKGTVTRWSSYRSGGKSIWRIELYFNGGRALILPSKIKNGKEVLDYVKSLPALH